MAGGVAGVGAEREHWGGGQTETSRESLIINTERIDSKWSSLLPNLQGCGEAGDSGHSVVLHRQTGVR